MGIAGDGVDFASDFLELGVVTRANGHQAQWGTRKVKSAGRRKTGPVASLAADPVNSSFDVHLKIGQFMPEESHHRVPFAGVNHLASAVFYVTASSRRGYNA